MPEHTVGSREEWLAARLELLEQEKDLTRRSDELARQRPALPWVPVEKEYTFESEEGTKGLAELFDGRPQLLAFHFMFGVTVRASACNSFRLSPNLWRARERTCRIGEMSHGHSVRRASSKSRSIARRCLRRAAADRVRQ